MSDEELLDLRICDLDLKIERTVIARRVNRLYEELDSRGIVHKPHVWLSSEWFSPDGVPGIAIPFYLTHPRLMKLEQRMLLGIEGARERECMRLLRHEAGHAISTAYRLHYRKPWRDVFGSAAMPYPDSYRPKPNSRKFVLHLSRWYAQAHPAEDFAETFAVWLKPGSRWRKDYQGWPALRKLEFVDSLMRDLAGSTPPVRIRRPIEPLREIKTTLREFYQQKRRRYGDDWPDFYDRDLRRIFSDDPKYAGRETAALFLRRIRPEVREIVAGWTGEYAYTIDQVLRDMIDRCKELKLRLAHSRQDSRLHVMLMVSVQTVNYLHSADHWVTV